MIILTDEEVAKLREALDIAGIAKLADGTYLDKDCKITFAKLALDAAPTVEQAAWVDAFGDPHKLRRDIDEDSYAGPLYARTEVK